MRVIHIDYSHQSAITTDGDIMSDAYSRRPAIACPRHRDITASGLYITKQAHHRQINKQTALTKLRERKSSGRLARECNI